MPSKIYLDHATAALPFKEALDVMLAIYRHRPGILLQPHQMGQELYLDVDKALSQISEILGLGPKDQFYSTSGDLEKLFFSHYCTSMRETGRTHILVAETLFQSGKELFKKMQQLGCQVKVIACTESGHIDVQALKEALRPRVSLFSMALVDPLTGVIQPIAEITEICRESGVLIHVDASAAIGKISVRFDELSCDYLTFEGAKIGAPQGSGGLAAKFGRPLAVETKAIFVAHLCAVAEALRINAEQLDLIATETARLREKFEQGIIARISGVKVQFQEADRSAHISAITCEGIHQEALLYALHRKGVYAAYGKFPSTLSFSFSAQTTDAEIEAALDLISQAVKQLQQIGGVG